ncbi:MAG: sigma-54 dependent transcriptional regulator [Nannocystaceae bacterium]
MSTDKPPHRILVVDDEPAARSALTELLRDEGYEVLSAADGFKAIGRIDSWEPDVVITDIRMPALDGLDLTRRLRERLPDVAVIVMTAHGSVEGAVGAMHLGATDYLPKPIHFPHLLVVLERVLAHRALQREARGLREGSARGVVGDDELVGDTRPFRELLGLARQVADTPASVLLAGEVGVGKRTLARLIHRWSGRPGPLVEIEVETLADPEVALFGDGSAHPGAIVEARGGTLLLRDIDQLPSRAQARLISVLQEPRVGGDVRLLVTTSRDLAADVHDGRFRRDLYFRINVVSLRVPSLRERRDDVPLLAQHVLRRLVVPPRRLAISARALGILVAHEWSGNVQQLESCLERAVSVARGGEIEPRDLPPELLQRKATELQPPKIPGTTLYEIERYAILRTLEHVGGSTRKAAKILGISPRKIQYRIHDYRGSSTE